MDATPEIITSKAQQDQEKALSSMSPFEVKNLLLTMARKGDEASSRTLLNAGRGNPNWICTLPREGFYLLGTFGIEEAQRSLSEPDYDLAGMPEKEGISQRFLAFLDRQSKESRAAQFLRRCYDWCCDQGFDPDGLVMEWAQGINGCEYPVPERILHYTQEIVRKYLVQEMTQGAAPQTPWDLFATEGGTAAMCYLFYSLKCNFLINPGDKVALMTPIFTPYLGIPPLDDYDMEIVQICASAKDEEGLHTWQYPESELEKLGDPAIKLLCLVNPSNPPSYAMDEASQQKMVQIIKEKNPNLLIITDDVYGTFVENYHSILQYLPRNTACVYSFSKYFGATGWRLATIAVAHDNLFDELIRALPADKQAILISRYSSLTDDVPKVRFVDRMVADSRLVALNGTAGLSTPQQVLMSFFALHSLMDTENVYKHEMQELIHDRYYYLWKSLGWPIEPDPLRAGYYAVVDLGLWAQRIYGADFEAWLKSHFQSLDIVIRLAKETGIVVMNGPGFDAPDWSIRVSLANLKTTDYIAIGEHVQAMLAEYAQTWKTETAQG